MPNHSEEVSQDNVKAHNEEKDIDLYKKLLMVFAVAQIGVAMLFHLVTAASPWLVLAVSAAGVCLAYTCWQHKLVRILMRSVFGLIVFGSTLLVLAALIAEVAQGTESLYVLFHMLPFLSIFLETILLGFLPAFAAAALHTRKLDLIFLRIVSTETFICTLITYFIIYRSNYDMLRNYLILLWDNEYLCLFFVLCTAVTMVMSFMINPPTVPVWIKKRMQKRQAKREAKKG